MFHFEVENLVSKKDDGGEYRGLKPLFWIYYPEARYVFVKSEVYNRGNDVERRTYEDIFWKRQFGSFIVKKRAEKTARNISKNTTIIIPEHFIPSFKPSKRFVNKVKGNVKH